MQRKDWKGGIGTVLKVIGVVLVIDGALAAYAYIDSGDNIYSERYNWWFQLTGTSTVHDYRATTDGFRARWLQYMCHGGRCLHRVDWACGFSISALGHDAEQFSEQFLQNTQQCFKEMIQRAPLVDTLDKLRILCGRRHMAFIGGGYWDQDKKKDDCRSAGGEWVVPRLVVYERSWSERIGSGVRRPEWPST